MQRPTVPASKGLFTPTVQQRHSCTGAVHSGEAAYANGRASPISIGTPPPLEVVAMLMGKALLTT